MRDDDWRVPTKSPFRLSFRGAGPDVLGRITTRLDIPTWLDVHTKHRTMLVFVVNDIGASRISQGVKRVSTGPAIKVDVLPWVVGMVCNVGIAGTIQSCVVLRATEHVVRILHVEGYRIELSRRDVIHV